jgi:hypothetical protein
MRSEGALISHGGTRRFNPGIDNNMFYIGLARATSTSSATGDVSPARPAVQSDRIVSGRWQLSTTTCGR